MTRGELNYLARQVAAAIEVPVTTEKLAELTGWTVCAINNMVARKEIPVIHFGTRRMFSPSAVREAIINNTRL